MRGDRIVLTPFPEQITAEIRPTLEVLLAGALLLLVAAAAGVASLRLSQALAEQRVSGIRRAMGATPEDEMAAAGFRILLLAVPVRGRRAGAFDGCSSRCSAATGEPPLRRRMGRR